MTINRGWLKAGITLALAGLAVPAAAQSGFTQSDGEAFLKAIEEGDNNAAIPLIEQPGSRVVNYKGYKGETALHIAARERHLDWVGYLLKKGADPNIGNREGDTPLMIAARIGLDEAVDWMVRLGADVDMTNRRGETALIIAVQQKRPRIVQQLLEAGADPDKTDHAAGYSARDYAKRDSRNPRLLELIESVKTTKKKVAGPKL
ncbi:MAG: ankyrin repeat domain-containing protein [Sphingomonas sp.]|nr:ankyrin repeat domain-containing protein [Sphingomonas sp.]